MIAEFSTKHRREVTISVGNRWASSLRPTAWLLWESFVLGTAGLYAAHPYGENAIHDVISRERASITRWSYPTSKYFQRRSRATGAWKSFDPTESRFEPRSPVPGIGTRGKNRRELSPREASFSVFVGLVSRVSFTKRKVRIAYRKLHNARTNGSLDLADYIAM